MNNRQNMSRLEAYLDGELTPSELSDFENELERSPELKQELALAQKLKRALSSLPENVPNETYFDEVTDIILARTVGSEVEPVRPVIAARGRLSILRLAIPVAASLLIFFGALSLSSNMPNESPVIMPLTDYEALSASDQHFPNEVSWDLADKEVDDMAIGITAISSPGRATGFANLSDVISVRLQ